MANGRRQNRTGRSDKAPRWVQLEFAVIESPAFLALSSNAKVALLFMLKRYDGFNNGKIVFACRDGCVVQITGKEYANKPFGLSRSQLCRAIKELEDFGFIDCTQPAKFDQKRLAREWRLTWLPFKGKPPTREYMAYRPRQNLKASLTSGTERQIQSRQCDYETCPIEPKDHYSLTSVTIDKPHSPMGVTHLVTMGSGGTVIQLRGGRSA
jgi:hypothetical protein